MPTTEINSDFSEQYYKMVRNIKQTYNSGELEGNYQPRC